MTIPRFGVIPFSTLTKSEDRPKTKVVWRFDHSLERSGAVKTAKNGVPDEFLRIMGTVVSWAQTVAGAISLSSRTKTFDPNNV